MSSLIGAYARILMPIRGATVSGSVPADGRTRPELPTDPLSLSLSSAIYQVICWVERTAMSVRFGRGAADRRHESAGESDPFDA